MHTNEEIPAVGNVVQVIKHNLLGFVLGVMVVIVAKWLIWRWKGGLAAKSTLSCLTRVTLAQEEETKGKGKNATFLLEHQQHPFASENNEVEEEEWCTEDDSEDDDETDTTGQSSDDHSEFEGMEDLRLKMVLVFRRDGKKMIAQDNVILAADASMSLVQKIWKDTERTQWKLWYTWWRRVGCAKITLKCPDDNTLRQVVTKAEASGLPWHCTPSLPSLVADEEIGDLMQRVVAVGPAPSDMLDPITGELKLLS